MPVRLGNFIRERRQELGLTQEQLAQRIGDTVRQAATGGCVSRSSPCHPA